MSQIVSRLYVRVRKSEDFKELYKLGNMEEYGLNIDSKELFSWYVENDVNEFVIEDEWYGERSICFDIDYAFSEDKKPLILFESTDINVDPFCEYLYFLPDGTCDSGVIEDNDGLGVDIRNVEEWFKDKKLRLTKKRLESLTVFDGPTFKFVKKRLKKYLDVNPVSWT